MPLDSTAGSVLPEISMMPECATPATVGAAVVGTAVGHRGLARSQVGQFWQYCAGSFW